MFKTIDDVTGLLAKQNYISEKRISTVVFLAEALGKPVLIEGPAGVGKTDLAKVVSSALGRELVRLQCYEGLDEAKALYEWEYAKQLLYTQILKDKINDVVGGAKSLTEAVDKLSKQDDVFFSEQFLLPRPLLKAISSERPTVLLVDEIDKADPEFEAFLLEVLSDFQVTVPELGSIKAKFPPVVFLTSNNTRELSDALKRRCLHLFIDYPEKSRELEIVRLKVPEASAKLAAEVVDFVGELRKKDLKKIPSISETLDWARALTVLNVKTLGDEIVKDTLSAILKYEGDVIKAQKEMAAYIERQKAKAAVADKNAPTGDPRKDFLN